MDSNFLYAVQYVLNDEGSVVFIDPADGEYSKYGITLRTLRANGIAVDESYVAALSADEATELYWSLFWQPGKFDMIRSPSVAAKVFNISINVGTQTGIKLLQEAVNKVNNNEALAVDGLMGPTTATAVNEIPPALMVQAFEVVAAQRYEDIVAANPNKKKYLSGWLARVAETTGQNS